MTQCVPLTQWVGEPEVQGLLGMQILWLNILQTLSLLLYQHKVSNAGLREANISMVNVTKFSRNTGAPTACKNFMVLKVNMIKTELLISPLST